MLKLVCHCKKVEAHIDASKNLEKVMRCNCSICKRKGTIMSMVENDKFKIVKGENYLNYINFIQIPRNIIFAKIAVYTHITIQE